MAPRRLPLVSTETKLPDSLHEAATMKRYISYPRVAGVASRQAHADLPPDTYEREMSKDGFFGPAAHLYHRHPPTGWVQFEGPLRPHAFDLAALPSKRRLPRGMPPRSLPMRRCACASGRAQPGAWTTWCATPTAMNC